MATCWFAMEELAAHNPGFQPVPIFACDIKPASKAFVLMKHFPGVTFYDDVFGDAIKNAPYVDVLTAGFPCEPFSNQGKRKGTADTRGKIIFEVLDYVARARPRLVLLENVLGFASHFPDLCKWVVTYLKDNGYCVAVRKLDSNKVGAVAQRRWRLYIIAVSRDVCRRQLMKSLCLFPSVP